MPNELVIAVAAYLGARGTVAVDEVLKPVLAEVGGDVLRGYRAWKAGNVSSVFRKASAMAPEGEAPVLPPGRILGLVIENASFAEEDELQTLYAALLSNAFFPRGPLTVLPSYPDILKHLLPAHIAILDTLHDAHVAAPNMREAKRADLMKRSGLSEADYTVIAQDLDRLMLVEGVRSVGLRDEDDDIDPSRYHVIHLTDLGLAFILACTPPRRP